MRLELNVSEGDSNAVLWYEVENSGQGREAGKTITKTHFVHSRTTPNLTTYYHTSPALVDFAKNQTATNVVRAVLYSADGFEARRRAKKEIEGKIDKRACTLCVLTCGCAICLCGPCGCCDETKPKVNEEYFCSQVKREYPDKVDDSKTYQFTADDEDDVKVYY